MYKRLLGMLLFGSVLTAMAANTPLTAGVQYQVLPANLQTLDNSAPANAVVVTEFFSFACPHCFMQQPYIQQWLKTKPKNVVFQQIPVGFGNAEWVPLAKAYYVIQALGKTEVLAPAIFKAIHVQHISLFTENDLATFCAQYGVDPATFKQYYESFSVAEQLRTSDQLAQSYGILGVPSIVVGNQYETDVEKAGGKDKLMGVVNQLVEMAQTPQ